MRGEERRERREERREERGEERGEERRGERREGRTRTKGSGWKKTKLTHFFDGGKKELLQETALTASLLMKSVIRRKNVSLVTERSEQNRRLKRKNVMKR